MYKNNLVASISIKDGTEFLREIDDTVRLPFGAEYQIYLKNLNTTKALVNVYIDGKDVLDGNELIISPNESISLERFIEKGNLAKGHRFKFIEKTDTVRAHRGDQAEDGLVRVTYKFEKPNVPNVIHTTYHPYSHPTYVTTTASPNQWNSGTTTTSATPVTYSDTFTASDAQTFTSSTCKLDVGALTTYTNLCANPTNVMRSVDGITAKGSVSEQKFSRGNIGLLEQTEHVIVLQLKGTTSTPIVTSVKLDCDVCGTKNPSFHKYCRECGNCLIELD